MVLGRRTAWVVLPGIALSLSLIQKAHAACPICTVAVGGMMVLLEQYGVDNTITGIWIGGFVLSTTLWALDWLHKKEIKFFGEDLLLLLFFYLSLIVPLYAKGIIGMPNKMMWGADKAVLGMLVGGIIFHFAHLSYLKLKEHNGGKPWFPFQRVIFPVVALGLVSGIFYFLSSPDYLWHFAKGYMTTPLLWVLVPVGLITHLVLFKLMDKIGVLAEINNFPKSCH